MTTRESAVRVGLVYPELLGTYGDRGNALTLVQRCRWRGIPSELVEVAAGDPIPESLDVFLFGGGEDDPQAMAASGMRESRGNIERAWRAGAVVFAVCAGFQLIGHRYVAADGAVLEGIGLVDAETHAGSPRLIGEVVAEPDPPLSRLTGFENHGGRTTLAPGVRPLGRVIAGGGNGDGADGAFGERVIGTYLHGPVLPRNPALADHVLEWVVGPLPRLDDTWEQRLHAERLRAGARVGVVKWWHDVLLARG